MFSIIGGVREPLRYPLDKANYRLLQAMAQAQDIYNVNTPYVYVIRQVPETRLVALPDGTEAERRPVPRDDEPAKAGPPQLSPEEELEELLEAIPGKSGGNDKSSMSDAVFLSDASWRSDQSRSSLSRGQSEPRRVAGAEQKGQAGRRTFDWPLANSSESTACL